MNKTGLSDAAIMTVQKPAQYLGGERGSILKSPADVKLRFCLAFPDTYEVGMSHVGYQILYDLINRDSESWAERVYVPLPDMEALIRRSGSGLRSLESGTLLSEFDVVGFSLQYELCMSGILGILDLGGIPLLASERQEKDPIIIGGGPVAYHPEPFSDFFDAFLIGDGEELVPEFNQKLKECKEKGLSRRKTLEAMSTIQGVYVPAFFEALYNSEGEFAGFKPLLEGYQSIQRRVIPSLEYAPYPEAPIVPNIRTVHDRLSVEVMRGCVRGCRFCQAGYLYRPQRERSPEQIKDIVQKSLAHAGYEELSLLSLSTADYCSILPLLKVLKDDFAQEDNLAISFPSTRVDALKPELLQEVQPIRRSGFTMAPEAGTQRLRDVINKGVTDQEILETCSNVFRLGWSSVKLYFMIGLPGEHDEDIQGIIDIARKVKKIAGRRKQVTVSVSTHVPKPHTPFQWAAQISAGETKRRQQLLFDGLRRTGIGFRYHDAESTFLEGVFARGDRKLSKVILRAYELGSRLDGWVEELSAETWMQAFKECGIEPESYLQERRIDQALPWDLISCDIPKKYFEKEWRRALDAATTPDCLNNSCSICGACDYDAVRNVLFDRRHSESRLKIVNPAWNAIIEQRKLTESLALPEDLISTADTAHSRTENSSPVAEQGKYTLKEYLRTETPGQSPAPERNSQPIVQRLRCRYEKIGNARFFAHLELASLFFRAARRANLPVAYSKGFNPKPKFSFGPPTQLGLESECELVDIALTRGMSAAEFIESFNAALPVGLKIKEATPISSKAASIQSLVSSQAFRAEYDLNQIPVGRESALLANWQDISVKRRRKGKEYNIALKQVLSYIKSEGQVIEFELKSDEQKRCLKPYEFLSAITEMDPLAFQVRKISSTLQLPGGENS